MIRRIPLAVVGAALGVGLLVSACGGDDGGSASTEPIRPFEGAPTLEIVGNNLSFEPEDLEVGVGDFNVTLESVDQFHDFTIEGVDGIVEAGPGATETQGFTIDEAGDYTFYCSVTGHREGGMEGTLTVNE
jgi:plastocyanin